MNEEDSEESKTEGKTMASLHTHTSGSESVESEPIPLFDTEEVAPPAPSPIVEKITKIREFWRALNEFLEKAQKVETTIQSLDKISEKLREYLEVKITKLERKSVEIRSKFLEKLDFRLTEAGSVAQEKYMQRLGGDMLAYIMNLAHIDSLGVIGEIGENLAYTAQGAAQINIHGVSVNVGRTVPPTHKLNSIIDSLSYKTMEYATPKDTFMSLCDYMLNPKRHIRRTLRIIHLFAVLMRKLIKKRAQFLPGWLFTVGGLLKAEAASYLKGIEDSNTENPIKFTDLPELFNNPGEQIRSFPVEEQEIFHGHMCRGVLELVSCVCSPGMMRAAINGGNEDYYERFVREEFIDDYEDDHLKKPEQIIPVECYHYKMLVVFDTLQFFFKYFVVVNIAAQGNIYGKREEWTQEERIKFRSINPAQSLVVESGLKGSLEETHEFLIGMVDEGARMCPDILITLRLWRKFLFLKHTQIKQETNPPKEKEGYERTDAYNPMGIAIYSALYLLPTTQGYFRLSPTFLHSHVFPQITSAPYLYSLYHPVIFYLLTQQYTSTLGLQLLNYFIAFLNNTGKEEFRNHSTAISYNGNMNILKEMVNIIGNKGLEYIKQSAALLMPHFLGLFSIMQSSRMIIDIVKTTEEDRARGYLIDQLKYQLQAAITPHLNTQPPSIPEPLTQIICSQTLHTLFQCTFKLDLYILDILDSVMSTLTMYLSALLWDKKLKGELGVWNEAARRKVFEEFIDPLLLGANVAGGNTGGGDKEEGKGEGGGEGEGGVEVPPQATEAHTLELNKLHILRELVHRIGLTFNAPQEA